MKHFDNYDEFAAYVIEECTNRGIILCKDNFEEVADLYFADCIVDDEE